MDPNPDRRWPGSASAIPPTSGPAKPDEAVTGSRGAAEEERSGGAGSATLRAVPVEGSKTLASNPSPQPGASPAAAVAEDHDTQVVSSPALVIEGAPPGAQIFVDDQLTASIIASSGEWHSRVKATARLGYRTEGSPLSIIFRKPKRHFFKEDRTDKTVGLRSQSMVKVAMRMWSAILILLGLGVPVSTSQGNQLVITVPVLDESPAGSPIKITGTVQFSESIVDGKEVCSYKCDVEASNISPKQIVLLVVRQDIRCSKGLGRRRRIEHEYLFDPKLLGPEQAVVDSPDHCNSGNLVGTVPSKTLIPTAQATTLYAQFQDGTTFGDEKYALHLLQIRKGALKARRKLEETYAREGEQEFVKALLRRPDPHRIRESFAVEDLFIKPLRRVHEEHGTAEAVRRIREKLSNAEEKLASLGAR